jgi:hypothetical protein
LTSAYSVAPAYQYPLFDNLILLILPAVTVHIALIPTPAVAGVGIIVIFGISSPFGISIPTSYLP